GPERLFLPPVPDLRGPGRVGYRADGRASRRRLLHLGIRLPTHRRLVRRRPRAEGSAGPAARGCAPQGAGPERAALLPAGRVTSSPLVGRQTRTQRLQRENCGGGETRGPPP